MEAVAAIFRGDKQGYRNTRMENPNHFKVLGRVAALESLGLDSPADGHLFASGMAACLQDHPCDSSVNYPGLRSNAGHAIAKRQMLTYGEMLAFEVNGGLQAGIDLMNNLRLISIVPTLGNADTIVQHPASMSHVSVLREIRQADGVSDGSIRISVGIENAEDLLADLEQALG